MADEVVIKVETPEETETETEETTELEIEEWQAALGSAVAPLQNRLERIEGQLASFLNRPEVPESLVTHLSSLTRQNESLQASLTEMITSILARLPEIQQTAAQTEEPQQVTLEVTEVNPSDAADHPAAETKTEAQQDQPREAAKKVRKL